MAITGFALFVFVIGHLLGNLQVFLAPETLNAYGHFLHTSPGLLWPARLGLLLVTAVHLWAAISLALENRAARPVDYAERRSGMSSYASRTMVMSGVIIACFVVYHLLHFTVQARAVNLLGMDFGDLTDAKGRPDVHRMMVAGFSHTLVAAFYVVAVGLLCLHLSHGLSSGLQSLGLRAGARRRLGAVVANLIAGAIFAGYASIPLAIWAGWVR